MEESTTIYLVLDLEIFCYFWRNKRPFWGCLKETSHSIVLEKRKSGTLEGYFYWLQGNVFNNIGGFRRCLRREVKKQYQPLEQYF